ncbi:hypothetical protein D3261_07985 [Halococcus sp. IIIV-5B]|nr:hypothetical protein D3261_07985 [Halococcus sp. IIIV-5B]
MHRGGVEVFVFEALIGTAADAGTVAVRAVGVVLHRPGEPPEPCVDDHSEPEAGGDAGEEDEFVHAGGGPVRVSSTERSFDSPQLGQPLAPIRYRFPPPSSAVIQNSPQSEHCIRSRLIPDTRGSVLRGRAIPVPKVEVLEGTGTARTNPTDGYNAG